MNLTKLCYVASTTLVAEAKVTHLFFQAQVHELELQVDPCPIQVHQATVLQPAIQFINLCIV